MARDPRNTPLAPGVSTLSRSQSYQKKALFKRKKATIAKKDTTEPATKTVQVKGAKNGKTRTVATVKAPRFYPADDVAAPKKSRKTLRPSTTRASITPGTVLIVLSGRYKGKRVVYLKTLDSGLLLVTGPRKINGVPLRRVDQAYVIATSTKLDISKVKIDAKINDAYFKADRAEKKKADAEQLLNGNEKTIVKKEVSADRKKTQKTLDTQILAIVKKTPMLAQYLNASFSLSKGQFPHALKF